MKRGYTRQRKRKHRSHLIDSSLWKKLRICSKTLHDDDDDDDDDDGGGDNNNDDWPHYLIAEPPNTVHTCRRHSMVTAKITWQWPGRVTPLSKNIYSGQTTFTNAVTSDSHEMDRRHLVVRARCLLSCLPRPFTHSHTTS